MLEQMHAVLATEGEVAVLISCKFQELAESVRTGSASLDETRAMVANFRAALLQERKELIQQEIELYGKI